ncbi:dimethyladenosine transferase 2, mitochondrial [Psammomys obesus]|uniref:dimethyladenosine transferase 2, mitochondrial n=1 Tax=Psammomys obesus TaxID=48139 RepID=UPI0024536184|nr:dimethyladenosine transferase 2, mitochondrial [Psammomys obesus]
MWGPAMGLPPRLALSVLAGSGRSCILESGAATRKGWLARTRRGFSEIHPQPLCDADFHYSPAWAARARPEPTYHLINDKLAKNIARDLLGTENPSRQLILECNPGPGILTKALLRTGAKVVVFESEKIFIPHLKSLRKNGDGELQVVHCDLFRLDPRSQEPVRADFTSHAVFQDLGIKPVPWSAGVPMKIFAILPNKHERRVLWKILFDLYACESIFRYGRVELYLFVSEKEFRKVTATPERPDFYHVLSVLWQVACKVKFLHTEPGSSFNVYPEYGTLEKSKQGELLKVSRKKSLYLVRLTPRRNLFTENLSPMTYETFFHMVKHCFGKRNAPIVQHLRSLSLLDPLKILRQARRRPSEIVVKLHPYDFKRLFETIQCSEDSVFKWVYEDSLEDIEL